MQQAYGTQDPHRCVLGVPLQPAKTTQNIKEKTMNVYDIDIVTDSDEGRTVNVWTLNANNMAEALLDAFEKNKNSLKGVTEGAVMVTIIKQLSKQAAMSHFEAQNKVRIMVAETEQSIMDLIKPPVKH
jgi:hypothetical protein